MGVTAHKPVACTPATEEIEIQSCAPTTENVCTTADVASEEITYEKRCKEVVNKHCAGHAGLPLAHAGIAPYAHAVAPVAYSVPEPVVNTVETPCTEVKTEHCVDVPIIKPIVTPVETCHVVTKVVCTPAVHSIPKVTCEAGVTEYTHHAAPVAVGYGYGK